MLGEAPAWAGELQMADPTALYRSAVSLVSATPPTLLDRLARVAIPRHYIFGALSLANADMAHRAEELPRRGVNGLVVPGVGHDMGLNNDPRSLAVVLRAALGDS